MLKQYVKELRLRRPTEAESILWQLLRGKALGVKFRRQHIIGSFIADFCCIEKRLVVELDGGYHQLPQQQIQDKDRQEWLESEGYTVLRLSNEEIIFDPENTLIKIKSKLL